MIWRGIIHIFLFSMLIAHISVAANQDSFWIQDKFVIGNFIDPELSGIEADDRKAFKKYNRAHFNTLFGQAAGFGETGNYSKYNGSGIPNTYRLKRIMEVGDLQLFVWDEKLVEWDQEKGEIVHIFDEDEMDRIIATYRDRMSREQPELRDKMIGYFVADEPNPGNELEQVLLKVQHLTSNDVSKLAFFSLFPYHIAAHKGLNNWSDYESYIEHAFNNPYTKILAYDFYFYKTNHESYAKSNGECDERNDDSPEKETINCFQFSNAKLFADLSKKTGKSFWAFAQSFSNDSHLLPEEKHLRYSAFSYVVYGAKGIMWFTYGPVNSAEYENTIDGGKNNNKKLNNLYEGVSNVNLELKKMGPTLMRLKWIETIHGAQTDPITFEKNLPTLTENHFLLTSNNNIGDKMAIGIHEDTNLSYMTIWNKDYTASIPTTETLEYAGWRKPYVMDKKTGIWAKVSSSYNANSMTTTFKISVEPGDMELVRIGNSDITPIINLLSLE